MAGGDPGPRPILLLHPHPQFGGTMGSRLVHDMAVALAAAGHAVTRFNFRGVGRSESTYGDGIGEADDAAAAFDAVSAREGAAPVVVGYSFGGAVACRLATLRALAGLVLVGTPLRLSESALRPVEDAARVIGPLRVHVIVGERDGFVTPEEARALAAAFPGLPGTLDVVPGAGHFLEPSHNPAAVARVLAWLRTLLGPGPLPQ